MVEQDSGKIPTRVRIPLIPRRGGVGKASLWRTDHSLDINPEGSTPSPELFQGCFAGRGGMTLDHEKT